MPRPGETARRRAAFPRWRADAGMDNTIADRLPALFATVGLADIAVTPQHDSQRLYLLAVEGIRC